MEVLVEHQGPVARITLNRPQRRNPLSMTMMGEMIEALRHLPPDTQVVVVGGAGPAFSAGHDLGEMVGEEEPAIADLFARCTEMMELVQQIPQPVIARVHGVAAAAGCQLVASCDLAVATENSRFSTPGVKIGLFCSTPMVPVVRAVGRKRALEMLLTGETIDAATALSWGLINRVVPEEDLDAAVDDLIDSILRFSPAVIALGKQAFYSQVDLDQASAYRQTQDVMVKNALMADAQEGMGAFLEKRQPTWRDK
ncbi:MAG TPA: enoyl-CoA hydratase [Acidimicrobiia bacterium]|nr:enoyl-CoA hydratase [Acidimicrobiia bacterium]